LERPPKILTPSQCVFNPYFVVTPHAAANYCFIFRYVSRQISICRLHINAAWISTGQMPTAASPQLARFLPAYCSWRIETSPCCCSRGTECLAGPSVFTSLAGAGRACTWTNNPDLYTINNCTPAHPSAGRPALAPARTHQIASCLVFTHTKP